jgi:hypothetical protein
VTKLDIWTVVSVLEGHLRCRIEDPCRLSRFADLTPQRGTAIVKPAVIHMLELMGPVRFTIESYQIERHR